jgi:MbtH protein
LRTVSFDFESPEARFKVLINHEEQYSLWPADLEVPGGWSETGVCASKEECDKYLEETWTDMRPKSLRIALEAQNGSATQAQNGSATSDGESESTVPDGEDGTAVAADSPEPDTARAPRGKSKRSR